MYLRDHCFIFYIDMLNIDTDMQVALVVKNLPASAGDIWGMGLIPGLGRPPGGGHANPFQVFLPGECLGHRSLAGCGPQGCSQTWLKQLSMHTHIYRCVYICI